jgi:hypothetical protein
VIELSHLSVEHRPLVSAPHPDDEVPACGGSCLKVRNRRRPLAAIAGSRPAKEHELRNAIQTADVVFRFALFLPFGCSKRRQAGAKSDIKPRSESRNSAGDGTRSGSVRHIAAKRG